MCWNGEGGRDEEGRCGRDGRSRQQCKRGGRRHPRVVSTDGNPGFDLKVVTAYWFLFMK